MPAPLGCDPDWVDRGFEPLDPGRVRESVSEFTRVDLPALALRNFLREQRDAARELAEPPEPQPEPPELKHTIRTRGWRMNR